MTPGLVSVIVPTYNYAHFVTEAVDSALAQGYPQHEIIVVDDGSTDDTRAALARYGDRVRYLYQANQGLSAARNTGIRAAEGEYVALLDADDAWHPRKLELQVAYLRDHPEIGLVGASLFTERALCWPDLDALPRRPAETFGLDRLIGKMRFAPSSALIRRACLDEVGLFDPTLRCVEDRDMWVRFATRFRVAMLQLPLLWYRQHPASLSTRAARMEETELRVLRKAFAEVPGLRGRWLLRRKTFSQAAFASAQVYAGGGHSWQALRRSLRSFLLWPVPYRRDEVDVPWARLRLLAVLLLRLVGLKRSPLPAEGAPSSPSPQAVAKTAVATGSVVHS
jgi:glycosyltransferase involved in cell wall biosynthesis